METTVKKISIDLASRDTLKNSFLVAKSDVKNREAANYLFAICQNELKSTHYNKERLMKIIAQRILMLEDISTVYIDTDEEGSNVNLLEISIDEIELLTEVIKQNTN